MPMAYHNTAIFSEGLLLSVSVLYITQRVAFFLSIKLYYICNLQDLYSTL